MIRITLPTHLQTLARISDEVEIHVQGTATIGAALDALEAQYPMLRGTIRDYSKRRRPFLRFFACGQDITHESPETPLPQEVAAGGEPLLVVGAIAGG